MRHRVRASKACLVLGALVAPIACAACASILGDFETSSSPDAGSSPDSSAALDASSPEAATPGDSPVDVAQDQRSGSAVDASVDADAAVVVPPGDAAQDVTSVAPDAASDAPSTGFAFATLARAFVHANGTTAFPVTIQRGAGFTAPVSVTASGLPAGITGAPAVITGTTGTLTFSGNGTATIGATFVATLAGSGGGATASASLAGIVSGAPGALDATYPASQAFAPSWGTIRGCFLQPDGKVVLVGRFASPGRPTSVVVRLTIDGAIDTSFNPAGVSIDAGAADIGLAGALQPDGNIVVASVTSGTTRISRYLTTGLYDSSFQGQGWLTSPTVTLADPGAAQPVMFVLQPDGDIAIGSSGASSVGFQRWRTDGTADPSLGVAGAYGYTTVAPSSQVVVGASAESLTVGADGALWILGSGANPTSFFSETFALKLLPTTQVDPAYGMGGTVAVREFYPAGPPAIFQGAALYPHPSPGATPAAGSTFFGFDAFETSGANTSTLVPSGVGIDPMATSTTIGSDPAGDILLAGASLAVARFTPARALDTSFAGQGGETVSGLSGVPVCVTGTAEGAVLVGITDATRPVVRFWP